MIDIPRKTWDANEIALLKFCNFKGLTGKEIGEVLQRSYASITQMWRKVQSFENGVSDQGKTLSPRIKRGLQLEFRVRNDALNIEHQQRWLDKISLVTHIQYYLNPNLIKLKESKEEAGQEPEDMGEKVPEKVPEKLPALVSFSVSTEAVLAIIKAWVGR